MIIRSFSIVLQTSSWTGKRASAAIILVLLAIGFSPDPAQAAVRFSLEAGDTTKPSAPKIDSSRIDTTKHDTTSARADTVVHRLTPIPGVGSVDQSLRESQIIADSSINYQDYSYPGDLLSRQNGVFLRDLGSPGQFHTLTINGAGAQSITILADGVELNEPMSGAFDLNLYPIEHASRIEYIEGTRAFYYGFNATGGAINFVSKSKKALHPSSRMRYTEAAWGHTVFDGMLSQDVLRGLNVTAGFQHATTGGRYVNSKDDSWNARLKLRYNISNQINVFVSEMYNQTQVGLNNGIIDSLDESILYDRILDTVVNARAYEKVTRHDIQAGIAARLVGDTTLISNLIFYHSTSLREYRDIDNFSSLIPISYREDDQWSQWYGAKLTHTLSIGRQQVDAGAEIERRGVIASGPTGQRLQTRTALFGKTQTSFLHPVTLALYARFDNVVNRGGLSFGGDATISSGDLFDVFGGFSHAYRFPTIQEGFWSDSLLTPLNSGLPEQHDLFEAGIRTFHPDGITGEIKLFHRTIHDAYILSPTGLTNPIYAITTIAQRTMRGVSGNIGWRLGAFYAEGSGQYIAFNDSSEGLIPQVYGMGGIYYWNNLLSGHLGLKVGLRGRLIPTWTAPGFDEVTQRVLPNHSTPTQTIGVLDIILIARIGDAYIHFMFDNFFSRNYYVTSLYPINDRQTRFGVSWDFLD